LNPGGVRVLEKGVWDDFQFFVALSINGSNKVKFFAGSDDISAVV